MRTIIINTLGRELERHELFFLPFRDDQLFWLNSELGEIGACADEIEKLYSAQDKHQDYRLVVLMDLAGFDSVDKKNVRDCYEKLLRGYLIHSLLKPLADQRKLAPQSAAVIFVITRKSEGRGNVQQDRELEYVLGLDPARQPFEKLEVQRVDHSGTVEHLDVTHMFDQLLEAQRARLEDNASQLALESSMDILRDEMNDQLAQLQMCDYFPAGSVQRKTLPVSTEEFFPQSVDPELIWVDLQLNLSEDLARQAAASRGKQIPLQLKTHSETELAYRFARGSIRARYLMNSAPGQMYYPLENQADMDAADLGPRIWTALLEKEDLLPGVREAKEHSETGTAGAKTQVGEKLRRGWLRIGVEKRQFEDLCGQLEQEYDEQKAREQQEMILDTCAQAFRGWRSGTLRKEPRLPAEPSCTVQPELDTVKLEEKLGKAQLLCSAMAAEKLDDYVDLRQEAEEIKAKFRRAWRFWLPDADVGSTRNFQIYSLVLAVLFLVQMLVPYVGITLGQSGVELSRYVHFLISAVVFAGLYLVGLLLWMRQLCRELHGLSEQMQDLIRRSGERRRESIEAVVRAYSEALPQCTILYEDLRELRQIHETNRARKERYQTHMDCLKNADEMLRELETQLQLLPPDMGDVYRRTRVARGIDYQRPPTDRRNIPYYMLLSDDWGDRTC